MGQRNSCLIESPFGEMRLTFTVSTGTFRGGRDTMVSPSFVENGPTATPKLLARGIIRRDFLLSSGIRDPTRPSIEGSTTSITYDLVGIIESLILAAVAIGSLHGSPLKDFSTDLALPFLFRLDEFA